ncbi:MASE1 domain-containing protein [Pseudanabaena sp. ABRG5-3]|uniref:MASE1 domain-containing protein n=1 Tax=Pseudanabaena sp. ABRG5-3 TaxID=685565 RepID=UPI000DC737C7|nr:MASE1 domain-containing protein [Pseudanabaena sp. ABRG5-3]BBC25644.1 multi-sensor hybrid histidine kinase [Pseudanabaena sp. ABRG5-3]
MLVLSQKRLKTFPRIVAIVILALVYYGTSEISRHVAATPQSVTPVWPPDGFASAAVIILGYQVLPGVLIGSFLANIWAFWDAQSWSTVTASILQVLGIAIGTSIGTGVGGYLLRKTVKGKHPFRRLNDVYKFLLLTCVFAPMINATVGVVCLCLGSKVTWSNFGITWLTWWISNVAGICIFTPVILSFYEFYLKNFKIPKDSKILFNIAKPKPPKIHQWQIIEAIILVVIVICLGFISFYKGYDLEYMLIPCLVWTVLRFGQLGATSLIVIISTIAISGTVQGFGTFAAKNNSSALVLLQSFIIVIVVTTLSLIAILSEKQQAITNLQQSKLRLTNKSIQLEKSKSILNDTAFILEQQNLALTEAKQIAELANRTKTEFLSNMSHELRTPLNAILGLVQLLQESQNIDNQEKLDIQTIYQSGTHLLTLIDDILDISKIESGKMELHLQELHLLSFVKNLVEIIQVQANQKKIDFIYQFAPDLPELVYADSKRLKQILLNLLGNAVKFTNKGHVIFRVASLKSSQLEMLSSDNSLNKLVSLKFEIEDSGIGIDSSKLESIFLPFEQAGESNFKNQGTGLGLSISQRIADMMGGKITVNSRRGIGSVFLFTVSLQVPKLILTTPQNDVLEVSQPSYFEQNLAQKFPLKILIAEDNIVNQKVACKILNRLGYEEIDIAVNGIEVLETLRKHTYDVILMDVQMPEIDGIEVTKQIVNDLGLENKPYIIAVTANAMDADRELCLAAGMNDYVSKPVNVNLLVEALLRSQHSAHKA